MCDFELILDGLSLVLPKVSERCITREEDQVWPEAILCLQMMQVCKKGLYDLLRIP